MSYTAWIRTFAGVLAAAGLIVTPASAACADAIEWNRVLYVGATNDVPTVEEGELLGEGVIPVCRDTDIVGTGCSSDVEKESGGEAVDVFRVPGIHPEVALAAYGAFGLTVYVGPGFVTQSPDHPLHDEMYGSARRPNERSGWNCGEPISLTGTVVSAPAYGGGGLEVRLDANPLGRQDGRTGLSIHALTRITGFDRNGIPYIRNGDRLRASVRECTKGVDLYKVVPDTITALD